MIVADRVVRRARKRVRIAVEFNRARGEPAEIITPTKIDRRGRFRTRLQVPPAVHKQAAWVAVTHPGRGPLHGLRIGAEASRRPASPVLRSRAGLVAGQDHGHCSCSDAIVSMGGPKTLASDEKRVHRPLGRDFRYRLAGAL